MTTRLQLNGLIVLVVMIISVGLARAQMSEEECEAMSACCNENSETTAVGARNFQEVALCIQAIIDMMKAQDYRFPTACCALPPFEIFCQGRKEMLGLQV